MKPPPFDWIDPFSRNQNPPPARKENGVWICRGCQKPIVSKDKRRRSFCSPECRREVEIRSWSSFARPAVKARDKGVCHDCGTDTAAIKLATFQLHKLASYGIDAYDVLRRKASARFDIDRRRIWDILNKPIRHEILESIERKEANPRLATPRGYLEHKLKRSTDVTLKEWKLIRVDRRLRRLARARWKRIKTDLVRQGFNVRGFHYVTGSLWDMDHQVPVEEGGGGCGLDNLLTRCHPCHKAKTAAQARAKAQARREAKQPELGI